MAKAVLLTKNIRTKTHSGTINRFGECFIKTNIFPKKIGRDLSNAFEKRLIGDYAIFKKVKINEVKKFLKTGKKFVNTLKNYLKEEGFLQK